MTGLDDLYQEMILHHYKSPRNYGRPESFDREALGHNPLCGDRIHVFVDLDDGRVKDVHFEGAGCAISTASASVMTEVLKGRTRAEADRLFAAFHALVTGQPPPPDAGDLGKLEVFSGVSEFPMRVKCASLAWHTFQSALADEHGTVSTE